MRRIVDTFLMNTTPVHTAFRALLQGPDGGYKGDLDVIVIADMDRDTCLAALAILPGRIWRLHATDPAALARLVSATAPLRIEGEAEVVRRALEHPSLTDLPGLDLQEYLHLTLAPRKTSPASEGHHRIAREVDIPRLEQYVAEYSAEMGETPSYDWERLIVEKRVLMGMVEGTVASVAVRGAETLDSVQAEGVFTFKPFRRRGLARSLVAALARQAAGRGKSVTAIVGKENRPMLALLEAMQFHKTAEYLVATFSGEDDHVEAI